LLAFVNAVTISIIIIIIIVIVINDNIAEEHHISLAPSTCSPIRRGTSKPRRTRPRFRPFEETRAEGNDLLWTKTLPRAKRLRSALKADTFIRPPEPEPLHDVTATTNGAVTRTFKNMSPEVASLPVRASRKPIERGYKSDGTVILVSMALRRSYVPLADTLSNMQTKNNQYSVGKLPALPDRIRNSPNGRWTRCLYPHVSLPADE
jgi:hypothetical protein